MRGSSPTSLRRGRGGWGGGLSSQGGGATRQPPSPLHGGQASLLLHCVTPGKLPPHSGPCCLWPKGAGQRETLVSCPALAVQPPGLLNPMEAWRRLEGCTWCRDPSPRPGVEVGGGGVCSQAMEKQRFARAGSKHRCWHGRAGGAAERESRNR